MEYYKKSTDFFIEQHNGNSLSNMEHLHDLYEFYYLKNGAVTYLVDDKIYHLVKGDILVIPPNTLHKAVNCRETERERILFYFDKSFIKSIAGIQDLLPSVPIFCTSANSPKLASLFEEMLSEFLTINSHVYLEVLIFQLLVLLKRTNGKMLPYDVSGLPEIIANVLGYIASNYASNLTLHKIAKHFYVNPSYLSRLFKLHTGFTFCNYLNKYRVKEANKLLAETKKQITEIAFECGFNSSNNFCKCYKKVMETSPLAYRKRLLQK